MADEIQQANPELLQQLTNRVMRQITNQPAGPETSPAVLRAANQLRKQYPADMVGVRLRDMPLTDSSAFSNVYATTPMNFSSLIKAKGIDPREGVEVQKVMGDPDMIDVNPAVSGAFPQGAIEQILAHELQHIRQNRSGASVESRLKQFRMPYEKRQDEVEARNAADAYTKKANLPTEWYPSDNPDYYHDILNWLGSHFIQSKK